MIDGDAFEEDTDVFIQIRITIALIVTKTRHDELIVALKRCVELSQ